MHAINFSRVTSLRAVLPFGGSENSICHEIKFIFSDIDIIEAYRKTDTGIEFHDRITESVRAFIGEAGREHRGIRLRRAGVRDHDA